MRRRFTGSIICLALLGTAACAGQLPLDNLPLIGQPTATPTPSPTPSPTPAPTVEPYSIDGLRRFVSATEATRRSDQQTLVNAYMALLPPGGVFGEREAAFLYQGPGFDVRIDGDLNNWISEEALPLNRLGETDFWYLIVPADPAARIDYLLVVDGVARLDPWNPQTEVSPLGPRSKLVMPGYRPPPELDRALAPLPADRRGRLDQHTLESAALGQTRTIFIYIPAGPPAAGGRYPSIYFQDGTDYLNLIDATRILDRLIAEGEIPPLIAVFVPPIDRRVEYLLNDDYVNFLAGEVVPFVQQTYRTSNAPARTAIAGASIGGLMAVYGAASRPDTFGLVAAQSGAFALENEAILRLIRQREPLPTRYHLIVGSYETAVTGRPEDGNYLAANRKLADILEQKGNTFKYAEYPEGHSWGLWQARLGGALRYLFGP